MMVKLLKKLILFTLSKLLFLLFVNSVYAYQIDYKLCKINWVLHYSDGLSALEIPSESPYLNDLLHKAHDQYPIDVSNMISKATKNCKDFYDEYSFKLNSLVNDKNLPKITNALKDISSDLIDKECPKYIVNDPLYDKNPYVIHLKAPIFDIIEKKNPGWKSKNIGKCLAGKKFVVGKNTFQNISDYKNYLIKIGDYYFMELLKKGYKRNDMEKYFLPANLKLKLPVIIDDKPWTRFCFDDKKNKKKCDKIINALRNVYRTQYPLEKVCTQTLLTLKRNKLKKQIEKFLKILQKSSLKTGISEEAFVGMNEASKKAEKDKIRNGSNFVYSTLIMIKTGEPSALIAECSNLYNVSNNYLRTALSFLK